MPTVNGPDEITDLEAGNDKVFYSDSSGDVTEVALGAAATVLTSAGATSAPTFAVIPADATVGANKTIYSDNSDVVSGVAFGAAATVLTSSGLTSAPTWEVPAAGAGEITLNSSAAIALGAFVVLETAGTVKEVSSVTTVAMTFGTKWTASIGTQLQYNQQEPSVTWDPTRNVFWCTAIQNGAANLITYIMEINAAGVVTMAQVDTYAAYAATTYGIQASCIDTTNDKLVVIFVHNNAFFYTLSTPLSGTGSASTVGTWEGPVQLTGSYYNWTGVPVKSIYVAAYDRTYFFFSNYNQYAMCSIVDTSGAAPVTVMAGNYVNSSYTNQYYGYDTALAANGNICVMGAAHGSFAGSTAYNIIPSASNITNTGETRVMTGPLGTHTATGIAVVYDASQTKMVGYQVANNNYQQAATWVLPLTGAPTTLSTTLTVSSSATFSYTSRVRPPLGYDDVNGYVVCGFVDSSTTMIQFDQIITSGTNPTMLGAPVVSTMSKANWFNYGNGQGFTGSWIGFAGLWGWDAGGYAVAAASIASTATAQIGVAQNAATGAAEAVTIKTIGALDETGTGMTIGDVYLDQDGNRVFASGAVTTLVGRAISSTKLLITQTGSGVG